MPLRLSDVAAALPLWDQARDGVATLINHSENRTYRIDLAKQPVFTLRVHRTGYQSGAGIESELAWLLAIRKDTDVPTVAPVPGRNGGLVQHLSVDGRHYAAVLFHFVAGQEPETDSHLQPLFATLGTYAAQLHAHATDWRPPIGFTRPTWDAATILDPNGLWGDWRVALDMSPAIRSVLDDLDATLRLRLRDYGTGRDRFGLIHADMRLGNLLVDDETVTLIDFDDCGFCWFAYDFAASISFIETAPSIPALKAAWLQSYRTVRAISADDIDAIDTMILLRRMALLAWIGSHGETELARTHRPGFAEATAELAERYLQGRLFK